MRLSRPTRSAIALGAVALGLLVVAASCGAGPVSIRRPPPDALVGVLLTLAGAWLAMGRPRRLTGHESASTSW